MAGKGMGIASKGGGCVESGPRNKYMSKTSKTSGPVMMAKGGEAISQHKLMAMGKGPKKMRKGGMC
jgi:hypothetical protein